MLLNVKAQEKFSSASPMYPFTTENLSGYIEKLTKENATVLTVSASGDHAINAALAGASEVVMFDSNVRANYWSELKHITLLKRSLSEFKAFFLTGQETQILSYFTYNSLREFVSQSTRNFFDNLYDKHDYDGYRIHNSKCFHQHFQDSGDILRRNSYLFSNCNYKKAQKALRSCRLSYLYSDVHELSSNLKNMYDLILLSNIADYADRMYQESAKPLETYRDYVLTPLLKHISSGGLIAAAYVYHCEGSLHSTVDIAEERERVFTLPGYGYEEMILPDSGDRICLIRKGLQ